MTEPPSDAADELIDELHALRFAISAYFDHDLEKYLAYLREFGQALLRAGWKEAPPPENPWTGPPPDFNPEELWPHAESAE